MDKQIRNTILLTVIMLVVFPVMIYLFIDTTYTTKLFIHGGLSFIFAGFYFHIWFSLKELNEKTLLGFVGWLFVFIFLLPLAIELVAFLPVFAKGVAHLLVVVLFLLALFFIIGRPRKKSEG